jgi:hypothetical protein
MSRPEAGLAMIPTRLSCATRAKLRGSGLLRQQQDPVVIQSRPAGDRNELDVLLRATLAARDPNVIRPPQGGAALNVSHLIGAHVIARRPPWADRDPGHALLLHHARRRVIHEPTILRRKGRRGGRRCDGGEGDREDAADPGQVAQFGRPIEYKGPAPSESG